jgi:hypothetical protein
VFEGTAVEAQLPDVGSDGLRSSSDPEVITFTVDRVHKGEVRERQEVVTEESGVSCGLEVEVGGSYLVFAGGQTSTLSPTPGDGPVLRRALRWYPEAVGGTASSSPASHSTRQS